MATDDNGPGTAAIGLARNCPLAAASPRIITVMRLPDRASADSRTPRPGPRPG
ncbi:hypothetical protein [Streptomyces venezuelae]|uniref:hypothetical protein n=1 Tax=Streptomyces venezuelae TaxID=54571 RepID=UPI001681D175|nr:hypothetical protein [Streptomyces venezuelae]